ncbi:MAG: ribosomal L7Ae/L30e/S12e/Gadd45 family protein [Clostridia bacterium]|nr:ribosomal L7Ae/L30e/S12e/Gadd45 family protein [Clostridia bacterium]
MLENLKSSNKTVGLKQSTKALESGTVKQVYIAQDADERVIRNIKELCQKSSVDIVYVDCMKQLGKACGIEVGAAVVCLLK